MGSPDINSGEISANSMQNLITYLPQYLQTVGGQIGPTEQAKFNAESSLAPQRAQLQLDQYKNFMPQFSQIGSDIGRQQQLSQAGTDLATVEGSGGRLGEALTEAQKKADPEYYRSRGLIESQMGRLNDSIVDPNSGLSPTERTEVDRSLARDNYSRGNEAPTATSTVSNALAYGREGEQRRLQRQAALQGILGTTAGSSGALKSGIDVGSAILNRPIINSSDNRFTNPQAPGNEAFGAGQNLFNQFQSTGLAAQQGNQNKKTAVDRVTDSIAAAGSVLEGV